MEYNKAVGIVLGRMYAGIIQILCDIDDGWKREE